MFITFKTRLKKLLNAGILKLLDVVYFDGSLEKGNENRIIFEFSKSRTIAIEVRLMEKKRVIQ